MKRIDSVHLLFKIQCLVLCLSLCWSCVAFSKNPTKSICARDPYLCKKARKFIRIAKILQDVDAKAAMRLLDYVVKRLPTSNPLHKKALRELKKLGKAHPNIKPSFKKFVYQTKRSRHTKQVPEDTIQTPLYKKRVHHRLAFKSSFHSTKQLEEIFEKVWKTAKQHLYDIERTKRYFTKKVHKHLKSQISSIQTLEELASLLNAFFDSLGISHTHLYTPNDISYHYLHSLGVPYQDKKHRIWHIGAFYTRHKKGYTVSSILEGSPAASSGLRTGDRLLFANQKPFHPIHSFSQGKPTTLSFTRASKRHQVRIVPVHESLFMSMLKALHASKKILPNDTQPIGYVHLWALPQFGRTNIELRKILQTYFSTTSGLILDLRGGFGGHWKSYRNLFFANKKGYFVVTRIDRFGNKHKLPQPNKTDNLTPYLKPMVVLIDETTRSAKEGLAYQFKRSKRALLVGTKTAGSFVSAQFFGDHQRYLLLLAKNEVLLDGQKIEGKGIKPHFIVHNSQGKDAQLAKAIQVLKSLLKPPTSRISKKEQAIQKSSPQHHTFTTGTISIYSTFPASVRINGHPKGNTPLTNVRLRTGHHLLYLTRPQKRGDLRLKIIIKPGSNPPMFLTKSVWKYTRQRKQSGQKNNPYIKK